mgnify:CR=1 FL=1
MRRLVYSFAAALFGWSALLGAQSPRPSPESLGALKFRYVGPVGNRVIAIAGVSGQPHTLLRGRRFGRYVQNDR